MATFFATLVIFGIVVFAMAIGVIAQGKRLQGSCGGTGQACKCSPLAARRCALRDALPAEGPESAFGSKGADRSGEAEPPVRH
jgi:hypothetical protein